MTIRHMLARHIVLNSKEWFNKYKASGKTLIQFTQENEEQILKNKDVPEAKKK